jgi:hypothetical protein
MRAGKPKPELTVIVIASVQLARAPHHLVAHYTTPTALPHCPHLVDHLSTSIEPLVGDIGDTVTIWASPELRHGHDHVASTSLSLLYFPSSRPHFLITRRCLS